jgi:hypothetical protein
MTKTELLAILEQYEDDDIFLVSSDQEGNSFRKANLGSPEKAIDEGFEWSVIDEDDDDWYDEEDIAKAVRVGVFW